MQRQFPQIDLFPEFSKNGGNRQKWEFGVQTNGRHSSDSAKKLPNESSFVAKLIKEYLFDQQDII